MSWYAIDGAMLLVIGMILWLFFLAAQRVNVGFGGNLSPAWYLVPTVVPFGGAIPMWWVLPEHRRRRAQK